MDDAGRGNLRAVADHNAVVGTHPRAQCDAVADRR